MCSQPAVLRIAVLVRFRGRVAAKLDGTRKLEAFDFPGIPFPQPGIRLLDLHAILDALAEHAVAIAYAVAYDRKLQRGAAVEETGSQAAEAAVAEARIVLAIQYVFEGETKPVQGLARFLLQIETQAAHFSTVVP